MLTKGNLKIILISTASLVIIVGISLYFLFRNPNSADASEVPKQVLNKYFNAMEHQNWKQAAQYVIDNRFPNSKALVTFYKKNSRFEILKNYKILKTTVASNDKKAQITVRFTEKQSSHPIIHIFILIKRYGVWKVFVPGYGK